MSQTPDLNSAGALVRGRLLDLEHDAFDRAMAAEAAVLTAAAD